MRFIDLLHMAFMNLWRRKLRAALTVLGMVIGTASIVVMISLGIGNSKAMEEMFASWGDLTTITVNAYGSGMGGKGGGEMTLDKKAAETFAAMTGVKAVMPIINSWGMVKSGKYATDLQLAAIDMTQAEAFGLKLEQGKFAHSGGALNNIEIVFSGYTLQNFYNPKNWQPAVDANGMPLIDLERSRFQMTFDYNNIYENRYEDSGGGEPVQRGKFYKITPVGVMAQEGNNSWYSYIDINVFQKLARENKSFMGDIDTNKYTEIWVKCETTDTVLDTKAAIDEMGYGTYTLLEGLEMMQESARQTQMLLGGIGAISLLVAAIGIVNTMLMSIYERTREIGIIKVLGCRMNNIAALFLAEAAYIGFFGGLLGLGLSYGLSAVLNMVLAGSAGGGIVGGYGMSAMSVIPAYLALFALVFSVLVALVSGLYPALRAMRLSALAAIRNE